MCDVCVSVMCVSVWSVWCVCVIGMCVCVSDAGRVRCVCVCEWEDRREEGGADTALKTKTPHVNVGKKVCGYLWSIPK